MTVFRVFARYELWARITSDIGCTHAYASGTADLCSAVSMIIAFRRSVYSYHK